MCVPRRKEENRLNEATALARSHFQVPKEEEAHLEKVSTEWLGASSAAKKKEFQATLVLNVKISPVPCGYAGCVQ